MTPQLFITIGILVAACVDYALTESKNWRLMFALSVVPAVLQCGGMACMPETPRWLASKGRLEEARRTLRLSRGAGGAGGAGRADVVEEELKEIVDGLGTGGMSSSPSSSSSSSWAQTAAGLWRARRALGSGLGVMALSQLQGINTVGHLHFSSAKNTQSA